MQELYRRREQRVAKVLEMTRADEQRAVLAAEYQKRYRDAFSPMTIRNIDTTWRLFLRWCDEYGFDPTLPVSPVTLAEYVDYLGGKIRANTIQTRLWAIGERHRAEFYPSPSHHRLVLMALRGVQRKYGTTIGQAPPLCKSEVLSIVRGMGSSRTELRNKALLLAASDSWCRASELVAMRVRDLTLQEDGTSVIAIERSKTDPYGRGEYAFLSKMGTSAVQVWIACRELDRDDFVFTSARVADGKGAIGPATVSRIFKKITGRKDVSAHSTRVGGVHDALRLGCDLGSIMVAGRWASPEMPAVYGRKILATQSAAAVVAKAYAE